MQRLKTLDAFTHVPKADGVDGRHAHLPRQFPLRRSFERVFQLVEARQQSITSLAEPFALIRELQRARLTHQPQLQVPLQLGDDLTHSRLRLAISECSPGETPEADYVTKHFEVFDVH